MTGSRPDARDAEHAHRRWRVLCTVGAVLAYFEYRSDWFFFFGGLAFVVGSILDILDGSARAGRHGKQTPFGGFSDSTLDRVGEGLVIGAIALVFMRDGRNSRSRSRSPLSAAPSSSPTRGRRRSHSGSRATSASARAERVVVIAVGLALAPWGVLPWAIGILAAAAWVTVLQRILHVRRELRTRTG